MARWQRRQRGEAVSNTSPSISARPRGDGDDRVPLPKLQEGPRPTAVFRWGRSPATDAHRVPPLRIAGVDRFDTQVVLPAVADVVLLNEALAQTKAKVSELDLVGGVREADAADLAAAVVHPVEHKPVQVFVAPAQHELERGVQIGDRAVAPHQEAPPDHRTDATAHALSW